jgi:hypothetical protein
MAVSPSRCTATPPGKTGSPACTWSKKRCWLSAERPANCSSASGSASPKTLYWVSTQVAWITGSSPRLGGSGALKATPRNRPSSRLGAASPSLAAASCSSAVSCAATSSTGGGGGCAAGGAATSTAPLSHAAPSGPHKAALVCGEAGRRQVDGRAARQGQVRARRAAVVRQWAEQRVGLRQVARPREQTRIIAGHVGAAESSAAPPASAQLAAPAGSATMLPVRVRAAVGLR